MAEEYLDIVDENNNLTGKKEKRSLVHEKGLWHRTVYICLYKFENSKLHFLTQQRSETKDRHPNEWTMISGGHVIAGSTVKDAIRSELLEEIGLNSDNLEIIASDVYPYESEAVNNKEFVHLFFANFHGDLEELRFNDGEVQAIAWRTPEEIENGIINEPELWADKLSSYQHYIDSFRKSVKL